MSRLKSKVKKGWKEAEIKEITQIKTVADKLKGDKYTLSGGYKTTKSGHYKLSKALAEELKELSSQGAKKKKVKK